MAGSSAGSDFEYHGIGIRLNSEYFLAHTLTIEYADQHYPFSSTKITKFHDAVFNFNPSILRGRVIRGEAGGYARGYYPEFVMKLDEDREIALYRIKTRSFLESEYGPVGNRFPLEKADVPKLPKPGFKAKIKECYLLTWAWKRHNSFDEPLIRAPVEMR